MSERIGEWEVHPAAEMFPLMSGKTFDELVNDIKIHGQLEPVVVLDGKLIDGRNRARACMCLGLECQSREWDGRNSVVDFIISENKIRRHLSAQALAVASAKLLPHLEPAAKERIKAGGKSGGKVTKQARTQKDPALKNDISTRSSAIAAKKTGASRTQVLRAARLLKHRPDLAEMVGRDELSLNEALSRLKSDAGIESVHVPSPGRACRSPRRSPNVISGNALAAMEEAVGALQECCNVGLDEPRLVIDRLTKIRTSVSRIINNLKESG